MEIIKSNKMFYCSNCGSIYFKLLGVCDINQDNKLNFDSKYLKCEQCKVIFDSNGKEVNLVNYND